MNKHYAEKGNFLDQYTKKLAKNLDADGNGILDFEAFKHCLVNIGTVVTENEARAVFEGLDSDGSGTIELKEIQQKVYQQHPMFPLQSHSDFLVSPSLHTAQCTYC